jgi:hypothetical protein
MAWGRIVSATALFMAPEKERYRGEHGHKYADYRADDGADRLLGARGCCYGNCGVAGLRSD